MTGIEAAVVIESSVPSSVAASVAAAAEVEVIKTTESKLTNLDIQTIPILDFDKYVEFLFFFIFAIYFFYDLSFCVKCSEHFVCFFLVSPSLHVCRSVQLCLISLVFNLSVAC